MTDKYLLRAYIGRSGETQRQLAEAMGISLSRLNAKINGWQGASFSQAEMQMIVKRYSIPDGDAFLIFLAGTA